MIVPNRSVVFLTKFCFDYDPAGRVENKTGLSDSVGTYYIRINAVPATGTMQLALFDDQSESYPDSNAMWGFQCDGDRLARTSRSMMTLNMRQVEKMGTIEWPIVETLRPRWWYLALIDCSSEERTISYSVRMLNTRQGWRQEFSMDHPGIITMCLFLTVYVVLLSAQIRAIMVDSGTAATKHPLRMILTFSIAAACFGMLLLVFDDFAVAYHGTSFAPLYFAGKLFKALSKFTLMSILLLLSKAYGISHALRKDDIIAVIKLTTPFFVCCLSLEMWGEYAQSRTYTTDFVFCTRYGAFLVCADLYLLAIYLHSLYKSQLAELNATKQSFYRKWGVIYATAFFVLPAITLIGFFVAPWCRSKVMVVMANSTHVFLLRSLVLGLWPEQTNPVFCIDDAELVETYGKESGGFPKLLHADTLSAMDGDIFRKAALLL